MNDLSVEGLDRRLCAVREMPSLAAYDALAADAIARLSAVTTSPRQPYAGWDPDPLVVSEPEPTVKPGCIHIAAVLIFLLALSSSVPRVAAGEPTQEVGTAIYTASATWCAPTPDKCQGWGGNARLAAVNSFTWGDEPYPVRVWRGEQYVDVTVVSFCACHGEDGYIDMSPAAWRILEPDLGIGRIDVEVEVLTDLAPHPDDDRMRVEDGGPPMPQTDAAP